MSHAHRPVAKRYATALIDKALEDKVLDHVFKDLTAIKGLLRESTDLCFVLNSPLPANRKEEILTQVFQSKAQAVTMDFLKLLCRKNRISVLDTIIDVFCEMYYDSKGLKHATIHVAQDISKAQHNRLKEAFEKSLNCQLECIIQTDSELLAGFKMECNDVVYDYSALTQLENFRSKILNR